MNSFLSRVKAAWGVLTNRYEAAIPSGPGRSWIPARLQDARFDADQMSRQEMARKIRYFERNLWLIQRLREVYTKYTVGPNGMPVIPASSDTEWNKRMADSYAYWCEDPTRDSLLPMHQVHRLLSGETHIDGEVMVLLTYRKRNEAQSLPAVQVVESHRVSSPGDVFGTDAKNRVDGVELNEEGKPVGFWVRDSLSGDGWTFREARNVIHIYDPERAGMYRAVTPYHAVLNTSHDLDDLEQLEMERARNNASIANILKTKTGEIPPSMLLQGAFLGGRANMPGTNKSGTDLSALAEKYKLALGSRTIALPDGADIMQLDSQNPSAATQWLWQYKIAQVCVSVNIPILLVMPDSIQGTVARAILDDAHQSFRSKFTVFSNAARRMYKHYAQWARYNVKGLFDAPADWWRCDVIPPRACNVDYGRNSAAMLAELAAGVTNWDDIAGATGSTAEMLLRKKARNVSMIKRIADEEGIEPAEISAPLADIVQKLAAADAAEKQAEMVQRQQQQQEEEV